MSQLSLIRIFSFSQKGYFTLYNEKKAFCLKLVFYWISKLSTVQCHYNAVNFLTNIHQRHPIARPSGRGMGVSFVGPAPDWHSAWVPTIIYAISHYSGPRYNGSLTKGVLEVKFSRKIPLNNVRTGSESGNGPQPRVCCFRPKFP